MRSRRSGFQPVPEGARCAGEPSSSLPEPPPLVLAAGLAGVLSPSPALARRAELILAVLVLAVALTIEPRRLAVSLASWRRAVVLSLLPFAVGLECPGDCTRKHCDHTGAARGDPEHADAAACSARESGSRPSRSCG